MNEHYRQANNALIESLIRGAESGRLQWQATAAENEFTAAFKGKYALTVSRHSQGDLFVMFDDSGREMLRIHSDEDPDVERLFEAAQRSTLNVDAAIREIVDELGPPAAGRSGSEISEDDIPF